MVMVYSPVYALEVGGDIRWDLPAAVTQLEVTANVEVLNNTTVEQVYAVSVVWAKAENINEFYSWHVIEFAADTETFNAFRLAPNMVFPFTLRFSVDALNKYAARLRLHCPREGTIYRDEFVDELICYFGELPAGWELGEMLGSMMPLLLIGMVVGMMAPMTKAFAPPEEKPPPVEIRYLPPPPPALPPGRE